jgi:hypothetical protein
MRSVPVTDREATDTDINRRRIEKRRLVWNCSYGFPLLGSLIMILCSQNVYSSEKEEKVVIIFVKKVSLAHIIAIR